MKLITLTVNYLRGIKELQLAPQGENLVIWGPNGAGKSAVVDAIDFLLTGQIPRLVGEGTEGVTLKAHGPHIDHEPDEAGVKATLGLPGVEGVVELRRSIGAPNELEIIGSTPEVLKETLDLAGRRQHSLSRREILKYVAAEAGKRATQVQALLNLGELEETRKALGRVLRQAKAEESRAATALDTAQQRVQTTLGLSEYSPEAVLGGVNDLRGTLGAAALTDLTHQNLKVGVTPPGLSGPSVTANPDLVQRELDGLLKILGQELDDVREADSALRQDIAGIKANKQAEKDLDRLNLLELGISLLDETGECPLCGYRWKPDELTTTLGSRLQGAKQVAEIMRRIQMNAQLIAKSTAKTKQHIEKIDDAAILLKLNDKSHILKVWAAQLGKITESCTEPYRNYLESGFKPEDIKVHCSTPQLIDTAKSVLEATREATPPVSPEQTAWDTLTTLIGNLQQLEAAMANLITSTRYHKRAGQLAEAFERTRDAELASLYQSIESRFKELYRFVHDPDEKAFDAKLRPDGASLHFEVDFYGRGKHPPLALHSEGHQDSMGICLYLALAEKLTQEKIGLTILDDVVMSVDAMHRRKVCDLLKECFSGRQFIITTHDKTWARQLQMAGVVKKGGCVEFTRWSIESGPCVELDADLWTKVWEDLDKEDVPSAAFRLRNGSERFFEMVCDSLQARVRYRMDGSWEMGDYMAGVLEAYKKLLRRAKLSAQSWKNAELFTRLTEYESIVNQIIQRTHFEKWAVNPSVHYNKWHELSEADFRPVCEAFRDLFGVFQCQDCGGIIRVAEEGGEPTSVRCPGHHINWNLVEQKKT